MGRTNATYRNHLEEFVSKFESFRKGLRKENKKHFDSVWERAFRHAAAAAHMNSFRPAIPTFVSVLVGQEREIHELENEIERIRKRVEELES